MPLDGLALTKPMRGKGRPFVKGGHGGPGRPKGSRHRVSEAFLQALAEHFEEHGADIIRRVAEEHPVAYVRLLASLVVPEPGAPPAAAGIAERLGRALREETRERGHA